MTQPEHLEQDENPAAGLIGWEGIPGRRRESGRSLTVASARRAVKPPIGGVTWAFGAPRGIRTPNRQIRSLGAAGKPASSWKGSAGWESRPLRKDQVEQGRTLTASLTEQSKEAAQSTRLKSGALPVDYRLSAGRARARSCLARRLIAPIGSWVPGA
jgi:hypothetical protein